MGEFSIFGNVYLLHYGNNRVEIKNSSAGQRGVWELWCFQLLSLLFQRTHFQLRSAGESKQFISSPSAREYQWTQILMHACGLSGCFQYSGNIYNRALAVLQHIPWVWSNDIIFAQGRLVSQVVQQDNMEVNLQHISVSFRYFSLEHLIFPFRNIFHGAVNSFFHTTAWTNTQEYFMFLHYIKISL